MAGAIVVVVQARTGSTRFPRKVLAEVAGAPVLARMLERVRAARLVDRVVVATTTAPEDDAIVAIADALALACVRGHATDLLDRHVLAARAHDAEIVVKIPSDCPLIDPDTIDQVIAAYLAHAAAGRIDYVSNLHPASWPDGFDVEVMSRAALELAHREATRALDREHTTPFLWDQPARFAIRNVRRRGGEDLSARYRLTLDYPDDLAVIAAVYDALYTRARHFTADDVVALLAARPALAAANARYLGTSWMDHHRHELTTLITPGGST